MNDPKRNLKPHAEALLHSWVWGFEYSHQGGGVIDFWERANTIRQNQVREMMERLSKTKREEKG